MLSRLSNDIWIIQEIVLDDFSNIFFINDKKFINISLKNENDIVELSL